MPRCCRFFVGCGGASGADAAVTTSSASTGSAGTQSGRTTPRPRTHARAPAATHAVPIRAARDRARCGRGESWDVAMRTRRDGFNWVRAPCSFTAVLAERLWSRFAASCAMPVLAGFLPRRVDNGAPIALAQVHPTQSRVFQWILTNCHAYTQAADIKQLAQTALDGCVVSPLLSFCPLLLFISSFPLDIPCACIILTVHIF
jgi:hypothetical protein